MRVTVPLLFNSLLRLETKIRSIQQNNILRSKNHGWVYGIRTFAALTTESIDSIYELNLLKSFTGFNQVDLTLHGYLQKIVNPCL